MRTAASYEAAAAEHAGVVHGLHLLPIYPSTGDGGFAPLTYKVHPPPPPEPPPWHLTN